MSSVESVLSLEPLSVRMMLLKMGAYFCVLLCFFELLSSSPHRTTQGRFSLWFIRFDWENSVATASTHRQARSLTQMTRSVNFLRPFKTQLFEKEWVSLAELLIRILVDVVSLQSGKSARKVAPRDSASVPRTLCSSSPWWSPAHGMP